MDAIIDDGRTLVTTAHIRDIRPIDGADAIELATVRGWDVVVKKDEFAVGDGALYFEIDSLLPLDDDRFAFLAPRGEKVINGVRYHRLKTARLRGTYSQGLLMPLADFTHEIEVYRDLDERYPIVDWAGVLGVKKYTEEIPEVASGPFPERLGRSTSVERVQNLTGVWGRLAERGPWVPTEKVDGVSCSVFREIDGTLRVCGRSWEMPDGDNPYWNAVREYDIAAHLPVGTGIQFEVYGLGCGRPDRLGVGELRIAVFNYVVHGRIQPRFTAEIVSWPSWLHPLAAPVLDLPFPGSVEDALAQAENLRSVINPAKAAEGIVWNQALSTDLPELGYKHNFKVLSNRVLAKDKG